MQLNHEWLKHGGCYSPGDPEKYFIDSLAINSLLASATTALNNMAGQTVPTASIEQLYSKNINVICDPNSSPSMGKINETAAAAGMFLELRTCWSAEKELIDCPAAFSNAFGVPCPEFTSLLA